MSRRTDDLPLHQEVLLLALRDDKGTSSPCANLHLGLGAAMLAELLLQERVKVVEEKRRKFLELVDGSEHDDELLDAALEKLAKAKRRAQLGTWVQRFSTIPRLHHRAAEQLVDRGILKVEEGKVLWLFKRTVYPELDGRVEDAILARLSKAIFTRTREIEARTVVLASIANSTGLLRANFPARKLKENKHRLEKLTKGELVGKAASEAVEAATAAIVVASVIPAVAATTVATSS